MEGELGLLRGNVIHSINITSTNPSNKKYKKTNIYLLLKMHPLSILGKKSIKTKKYDQLRISSQHILTSLSIVFVASTFIKRFPTASFR